MAVLNRFYCIVLICSLICLHTLVAYIANVVDPDCSLTSSLIMIRVKSVYFHVGSILECIKIYAADVISRQQIRTKNIFVDTRTEHEID